MSRLPGGARRLTLLLIGLGLLSISLVACASSGSPTDSSSSDSGVEGFKTPNPNLYTPTPAFPAFTIGAWPSNYSPQNNDTVTIYVLCRVQPRDLNGPGQPPPYPPGLSVHVEIHDPFTKSADGTTDASGLAAVPISFSDPKSGYPVRVYVSASWQGHTYNAETVFTPNVTQPPSPTVTPVIAPSATP
jgi:hypothetical protein